MKGRSEAEKVLAALAADARRSLPPEPEWDRMEADLMRRVHARSATHAHEQRSPARSLRLWAAFAAAGLAMSAWLVLPHLGDVEVPTEGAPLALQTLDGDTLPSTEIIESRDERLSIVHPGRAAWTLEPGGRAAVLQHGDVITVRLLKGAIRATVVPSPEPERFAVEAAETRVAVHGTVFRVELFADHNVVDVEEGVVAVSPIAGGAGNTTLLRAPAHAEFTPNGVARRPPPIAIAKRKRANANVSANATQTPRANEPGQASEAAGEIAEEKALPAELTIGEVEASISPVVAGISRCFAENTEASGNLRVTAQTHLTLDVAPDGAVTSVAFQPPLSPAVQACGEQQAYQVRFAPSETGAKITRVLELSR